MVFLSNINLMIKLSIGTSVMMFISLFFGSKPAAIGMTLFIINIAWIVYLKAKGRTSQMAKQYERQIQEAKENKQYGKYAVYSIAFPMCVVGLIVVVLDLVFLFMK